MDTSTFGSKFCGLTTVPCHRSEVDPDDDNNPQNSITSFSSAESKLLQIMRYPLTIAWLLGYQPLTIVVGPTATKIKGSQNSYPSSRTLTFKATSFRSFYCYTMMLISIIGIYYVTEQQAAVERKYKLQKPTEKFSQQLEGWATNMAAVFLKLFGLIQVKKTLSLWRRNVQLLETAQSLQFLSGSSQQQILDELKKWAKKSTIRLMIAVAFYILSLGIFVVASNKEKILQNNQRPDILYLLYMLHWSWSAYFHAGHQLFLLIFVKFYASCFHLVSLELHRLKVMCQQPHNSVDINGDSMQKPRKVPDCTSYIDVMSLAGIMGENNGSDNLNIKNSDEDDNLKLKIRNRLDASFKFIKSIELAVDNYNDHFSTIYILEVFLCILKIVVYSFFVLLFFFKNSGVDNYSGRGLDLSFTRLFAIVTTSIPVILYCFSLYNFGAQGSNLHDSATRIAIDLEDLGVLLPPGIDYVGSTRYHSKILLLHSRFTNNPPGLLPGSFFVVNRALITSVLGALTMYLIVLIQFQESGY